MTARSNSMWTAAVDHEDGRPMTDPRTRIVRRGNRHDHHAAEVAASESAASSARHCGSRR
jgi:hypothetical protein